MAYQSGTRIVCRIVVVALVLVAAQATHADAQVLIRWQPEIGEPFRWVVGVTAELRGTIGGREMDSKQDQHFEFLVTAEDRSAGGNLTLSLEVKRVAIRVHQAGQTITLDTARPTEDANTANLLAAMKPVLGQKVRVKCNPRGEILDVEQPDEVQALIDQGAILPGLVKLFSKAGLEEIGGASWVQAPRERVKTGETWTYSMRRDDPFFGVQVTDYTCRLEGEETVDGRPMAKIAVSSVVSYEPGESLPPEVELTVTDQKGDGIVYFDTAAGRPARIEYQQTATIHAKGMGREMTQTVTFTYNARMSP